MIRPMAAIHDEQVERCPATGRRCETDARAQDSAELTGVNCGDWRLAGGLSEVGQRQIAGVYVIIIIVVVC